MYARPMWVTPEVTRQLLVSPGFVRLPGIFKRWSSAHLHLITPTVHAVRPRPFTADVPGPSAVAFTRGGEESSLLTGFRARWSFFFPLVRNETHQCDFKHTEMEINELCGSP